MTLHELRQSRAAKAQELRSILDAANGADLADEARTRFDALEKEVRDLNGAIDRETRVAELERQAAATPISGTVSSEFDRECREYSLVRAIASACDPSIDAGREREISQELAKRNGQNPEGIYAPTNIFRVPVGSEEHRILTSTTSGAGVVPTDHRDDLTIDLLRARSVVNRLGATVLGGLRGNVSIPQVDAAPSAAWVAENGALSAADYDLNSKTMSPKHVGMLTEVSRNMLLQSTPDIEALVRSDFARGLAAALDSAALVGGGSNEPDGIVTLLTAGPGLGTLAGPTHAQVMELTVGPEAASVPGSTWGWALHPRVSKKLRTTAKVGSTDSVMIQESPNELVGYRAEKTAHAALFSGSPLSGTGAAIFGAWEHLLVGYWSAFDVLVNPYESTAYTKGNAQIRGMLTADIQVRHLGAFDAATDCPTP